MIPDLPAGDLLTLAAGSPSVSIGQLTGNGDIVVLAPHPDDETLGCGAAIAAAVDAGVRVTVILLTDGGASHPNSVAVPRGDLVAIRAAEFDRALKLLGDGRIAAFKLARPDGGLLSDGIDLRDLCAQIGSIVDTAAPRAIWSTWAHDPHCDHEAAAFCARTIAARRPGLACWSYAVWGRFGGSSAARAAAGRIVRFPPGRHLARKREAVAAYASQMTSLIADDPGGFVMPPALGDHFTCDDEIFVRETP